MTEQQWESEHALDSQVLTSFGRQNDFDTVCKGSSKPTCFWKGMSAADLAWCGGDHNDYLPKQLPHRNLQGSLLHDGYFDCKYLPAWLKLRPEGENISRKRMMEVFMANREHVGDEHPRPSTRVGDGALTKPHAVKTIKTMFNLGDEDIVIAPRAYNKCYAMTGQANALLGNDGLLLVIADKRTLGDNQAKVKITDGDLAWAYGLMFCYNRKYVVLAYTSCNGKFVHLAKLEKPHPVEGDNGFWAWCLAEVEVYKDLLKGVSYLNDATELPDISTHNCEAIKCEARKIRKKYLFKLKGSYGTEDSYLQEVTYEKLSWEHMYKEYESTPTCTIIDGFYTFFTQSSFTTYFARSYKRIAWVNDHEKYVTGLFERDKVGSGAVFVDERNYYAKVKMKAFKKSLLIS